MPFDRLNKAALLSVAAPRGWKALGTARPRPYQTRTRRDAGATRTRPVPSMSDIKGLEVMTGSFPSDRIVKPRRNLDGIAGRSGGPTRSRTGLQGFAVLYITALTSDLTARSHTLRRGHGQPHGAQSGDVNWRPLHHHSATTQYAQSWKETAAFCHFLSGDCRLWSDPDRPRSGSGERVQLVLELPGWAAGLYIPACIVRTTHGSAANRFRRRPQ